MSEKLCALRKIGGGTLINISSFRVCNVQRETQGYGQLILDVSKVKTLIIGSVTTTNNPSFGSYGYINVRETNGNTVIANLSISNNPQTVDVTNYNAVMITGYFLSSSSSYAHIDFNNITGK